MRNSAWIFAAALFAAAPAMAQQSAGGVPPLPGGDPALGAPGASFNAAPSATLKYRDPSQALTVGEMSKLQAKKLEDDFLLKLGYTSIVPARAATQREIVAKPSTQVVTLGIYGPSNDLQADVSINGQVFQVRGGQRVSGAVTVDRVARDAVWLNIQRPKGDKAPQRHALAPGEALEFVN